MIIVTGATGQLGGAVVDHLLEHLPTRELAVSVRDPRSEAARRLADRGVQVRRGDFTAPETLPAAFADASSVLIVSGPADPEPHRAAVEAAVTAGAERIVYTAHMAASPESHFGPARQHATTEQDLAATGIATTSLRNGFHASSAPFMLGAGLRTGGLRLPADGPVAWTAQQDLAVAAAIALTDPDRLHGTTAPLTASRALDMDELAEVVSRITGRTVTRTVVDEDEYRAGLVAGGLPEALAPMMTGFFAAARDGEFATVDPTLADLLGHEPRSVADVLTEALRAH
jgi:NAD(P)H dehydrogenase (quinone)